MATQWYYRDAGEERGPVTFRDLVELVRAGTVTGTDLVRSSWQGEWQPADSIVGLFYMAGRSAEELARWNPDSIETTVSEASADVAAPDADDVPGRPAWMTRLFSTAGNRHPGPSEIPIVGKAPANDSVARNATDAGLNQVAAASSTEQPGRELCGSDSSPVSRSASDAWSSTVEEAMARAKLRAAGLNPAVGRWGRLARRMANPLAAIRDMGGSRWIRQAFRIFCAIVCANLAAFAIEEWSAEEAFRFPRREATYDQDAGTKHLPLVGEVGTGEYAFLLFDAMLVAGAGGYLAARWLDSRAE